MTGPQDAPSQAVAATGAGGSIYDLGYQGYRGPRLGRASAVRALFAQSLRAAYGIGRGGRAKIAPFTLLVLAVLPAIVAVGVAALVNQLGPGGDDLGEISPIRYETYQNLTIPLIQLFCAAQAPELFGRDQRYSVLPLYFSRALARVDYALARIGGLVVAIFLVYAIPQSILFLGRVLVAPDPVTGFVAEAPAVPRIVLQGALVALVLGGLSALIAAWTPRRAYATAAIIAVAIVPPIVVALIANQATQDIARIIVFASPSDVLDGANAAIFGSLPDSPTVAAIDLPGAAYIAASIAWIVATIGLTIRRYQRIAA